MTYVFLLCAIVAEVIATSALKAANGFTNLVPSIIVVVGYAAAFYFLSLTLRTLPVGIAYAIWSGVGTALTALIGAAMFGEALSTQKVGALAVIVAGVVLLELAH